MGIWSGIVGAVGEHCGLMRGETQRGELVLPTIREFDTNTIELQTTRASYEAPFLTFARGHTLIMEKAQDRKNKM